MSDLKHTTKKAIAWSALDKGGQQLINALVAMVSMRLLAPDTFGTVAPLILFTGLANVLSEGGLSVSLIRKTDATEADNNTMFFFNFALSLLFYTVLFFMAPWIAAYNSAPELTLIARIQFLSIIFYSLGLIQTTQLIKRSDFRRVAAANVIPLILSGITVIVLAMLGFGVWALVAQTLVLAFSKTVFLWFLSGWKPKWMFSFASFRSLFGFSSKLLAGSLLTNISNNFYTSAIGKYFPMSQVGFYERANKFKEAGSSSITYMFGNSIFLMLSQLQHEPARFVHALRKSMRTVAFVAFPILLGMAAIAPPLMEILFTDTWLPAVPYIRLLCLSGLFSVFNYMHGNALKVKGRSDVTLIMEAIGAGLLISFLFLTVRYGLEVAVMSDVGSRLIVFISYSIINRKILGYRLCDQIKDITPYAGLGIGMAALLWLLPRGIHNNWLLLIGQLILGASFYLGIAKLAGSKVLADVMNAVLKRKTNNE